MRRHHPLLPVLVILAAASPMAGQTAASPSDEPTPDQAAVDAAVRATVRLLVHNQERYEPDPAVGILPDDELAGWQAGERKRLEALREDGKGREWPYEGVYRIRPDDRIPPGYRLGGTAICCEALVEAPSWDEDADRRGAVERGVDHMLDLLANDPGLEPGPKEGYDVRGWGHAYALKFFLRAIDLGIFDGDRLAGVEDMIPYLIYCIEANAVPKGGWNYAGASCSTFMTGSTLLALFHAKARGHFVDEEIVESALGALERARAEDTGAIAYSGEGIEPMAASAARAAVAELVLHQAGRSNPDRLRVAVEGFFENWEHLFDRKSKQGTHEGPYNIAPYYFFYGHTYAALAIEHLPEEQRSGLRDRMRRTLWATKEEHGGWNDRVFPRTESYSTAMVILALVAPSLPTVERWE